MIAALVVASLVSAVLMLVVLVLGRVYVARRLRVERAAFARHDRATWRRVDPMLVGAQEGSLSHMAGVVLSHAPIPLEAQFRTREVAELDVGTVRVSFEVGVKKS